MALVTSRCPFCAFEGRIPDTFAGKQVKCRKCGKSFPVVAANRALPGPAGGASRGAATRKRSFVTTAVASLVLVLAVGGVAGVWFAIQNGGHGGKPTGDSLEVAQGKAPSNPRPKQTASQPAQTQGKNPPQVTRRDAEPDPKSKPAPDPKADPEPKVRPAPEPKAKPAPAPEPKKAALPVRQMQETIKKHLLDNANDPASVEIAGFSDPLEVEIERPTESNLDQLLDIDGLPRKKNWKPGAIVTCRYRAKNAVGAKVLDEAAFVFLFEKDGLKFFGGKSLPRNVPDEVRVLAAVSSMGIGYRTPGSGWRAQTKELVAAYKADETAADKEYKGETLMVEGKITAIRRGILNPGNNAVYDQVVLEYGEAGDEIRCEFSGFASQSVKHLKPGGRTTIVGKCEGKVDGKLKFSDCKLELPD